MAGSENHDSFLDSGNNICPDRAGDIETEMSTRELFIILGYGISGKGAARLLAKQGIPFFVSDRDPDSISSAEKQWLDSVPAGYGDEPSAIRFMKDNDVTGVILSPGIAASNPVITYAAQKNIMVYGELEYALRQYKGTAIGITGTNGKSTTVQVLKSILCAHGCFAEVAGNIGVAVSAIMAEPVLPDVLAIEISSFQLEYSSRIQLDGAIVTNITADHCDRYATFADYAATKSIILERIKENGFFIAHVRDMALLKSSQPEEEFARRNCVWIGQHRPKQEVLAVAEDGIRLVCPSSGTSELIAARDTIDLKGDHMLENAVMAGQAALLYGAGKMSVAKGIQQFRGLEHRMEYVGSRDGIGFYNDSKATNIDAAVKALSFFSGNVHIILGGLDKGSDLSPLQKEIKKRAVSVMLIGDSSDYYEKAFKGSAPLKRCVSMEDAVHSAFKNAKTGDIVLLAPACASFDMYDNFEHRGKHFKSIANAIIRNEIVSNNT
ncbi:MAG: UDP-N-acetylmuramoyl-L-alanine--D-glutamate ligase [Candidatus Auribacterota bacterium]